MGPILNPQPRITATESWQAWKPCSHVKKETVNISAVTSSDTLAVDKLKKLEHKSTSDQTACGSQVLSGDHGELKKEISADDEHSLSGMTVGKTTAKETKRLERQAAAADTSDLNTVDTRMGANVDEHGLSADSVTLPVKDSLSSENQTIHESSSKDFPKDSSTNTVEFQATGCPECQKMRRQKEKPFLNKNKSCYKFVWNKSLLRGFEGAVHTDWILHIVNGFVGQSGILHDACS